MPFGIGAPELIILLVIVILIFGAGRIGKIASELGSGIRSFRKGLQENPTDEDHSTNNKVS